MSNIIKTIKDKLGNIIYPQTLTKAVYTEDNQRLDNLLTADVTNKNNLKLYSDSTKDIKFGIDDDGNYGYYKDGADSVTPFKNPQGSLNITVNGTYDVTNYAQVIVSSIITSTDIHVRFYHVKNQEYHYFYAYDEDNSLIYSGSADGGTEGAHTISTGLLPVSAKGKTGYIMLTTHVTGGANGYIYNSSKEIVSSVTLLSTDATPNWGYDKTIYGTLT